jgi:hypothetical protein
MKTLIAIGCIAIAASSPVLAAQQADHKKVARHSKPIKVEKLACRLGTEDEHARIAVELRNGRVDRFAYYSKWKPRTCSMEVARGDAYSKWEDIGDVTVVTLIEHKGAFLIDHERNSYHFIFREIDRMRYCGMEGQVTGSLTVFRGKPQCELEGVMEREGYRRQTAKVTTLPKAEPRATESGPPAGSSESDKK